MSESTLISKDGATLLSWVSLLESFPGNIALRQNWTSSNASAISPCAWKGVQCANNRITRLYLGQQNLSGPMPMGLGNLTSLTHLLMPSNSFNGSIPADVGNCTNLQVSLQWLINYLVFFHQVQGLSLEESGEILGKIGRDPSVSESDQLHLDHFSVFFHQLNVYSIDFYQVIDDLPTVLNLNSLFLKLHWPICN
jgi:hypothetical protein